MSAIVHDRAIIISSGDEIVTGQLLDTNSRYLADQLVSAGILPIEHVSIPDELPSLVETLRLAAARVPLVIISGGLGPTEGDLTRQALAEVLGDPLVMDEGAKSAIAELLYKRGFQLTARQERQALRPRRASCLSNLVGTAPGLHAHVAIDGRAADVVCLPGPPGELRPMFEREVLPRLRPPLGRTILTRLLHIVGIGESDCVNRLGDLTRREANPLIGITASGGILTLRVRYEGEADGGQVTALIDQVEARARGELGDHLFAAGPGVGYAKLAATVIDLLKASRQSLAVVESCTGGMLGEIITAISGSSVAFTGGFQTYSNSMKESIGVGASLLMEHGAVSPQVARSMAVCGLARCNADWCLAITGIAGPDGGSAVKPVGTVHIGIARRADGNVAYSRYFLFSGDREDVRRRSCVSALAMLYFALRGRDFTEPRLLWQVG